MPVMDDTIVEQTKSSYNADGNVHEITAKNAATGDQVTEYVYGTTLSDSEIAGRLLKQQDSPATFVHGARSDQRTHPQRAR